MLGPCQPEREGGFQIPFEEGEIPGVLLEELFKKRFEEGGLGQGFENPKVSKLINKSIIEAIYLTSEVEFRAGHKSING